MYDNLKERLTDMSVLASSRTPADALQYIEELEANLANAVEALRYYAQDDDGGWLANTTLAELTGGKDD